MMQRQTKRNEECKSNFYPSFDNLQKKSVKHAKKKSSITHPCQCLDILLSCRNKDE